ncbi:hypothetical protein P7C73_g5000, partial [Tremellales sp. Uapishka_1]
MTLYLPKWLENGFFTASSKSKSRSAGVKNVDMIKHLLVLLRRRGPRASVKFKYIQAHVGEEGNEGADTLAKSGAEQPPVTKDRTDWLDPDNEEKRDRAVPTDIEVEVDENWLLSPEELAAMEDEF